MVLKNNINEKRTSHLKIVFVTHYEILGPQNSGAIQCSNRNLYLLQQIFGEQNVYVFAMTKHKEYLSYATQNLTVVLSNRTEKLLTIKNGLGALFGRARFGKCAETSALKFIVQSDCDAVFLDHSLMGFLPGRIPKNIKKILFMFNIEANILRYRPRMRLLNYIFLLPTMLSESRSVKNSDIVITLNNRDATLLEEYYKRKADLVLPITFNDDTVVSESYKKETLSSTPLQLLFIGTLFTANEVGITWFVENVMPYVNAELSIVGKGMEKLANKLNCKNVKVIGTVDNLLQYYRDAGAVVSPIFSGGGMKVKTAEALMYGKPLFATDEALEGYDVGVQESIFRCNSKEGFITSINEYAKKSNRSGFDNNLRELFLEKYHTPSYIPILQKLLTSN